MSSKVEKHYFLSKDLLSVIDSKSSGIFKTQTQAIEYYLKRGLEFDEYIKNDHDIEVGINKCSKDIKFLKKLIIQLFVNKNFAKNRAVKDDVAYKEFLNSILKDKYID